MKMREKNYEICLADNLMVEKRADKTEIISIDAIARVPEVCYNDIVLQYLFCRFFDIQIVLLCEGRR